MITKLREMGTHLVNACDDDDWDYKWGRGEYDKLIADFRALLAPVPASGGSPLVRERDREWIMAMHAEDLEPKDNVVIENYVRWFEGSCTHGLEHDLKERDETIARLRERLLPLEELVDIIAVSHDAGIYHDKDGKCRVCELVAAHRALLDQAQGGVK